MEDDCQICCKSKPILNVCSCKYGVCSKCYDKYVNINGLICMVCKENVKKKKIFFAGKISKVDPDQDIEWADEDGIYYGELPFVGDVVPPLHTKLVAVDTDYTDCGYLREDESAGIKDFPDEIIRLSDYKNSDIKIPRRVCDKYIISGPVCIFDKKLLNVNHGYIHDGPIFANVSEYVTLLNERNDEMIQDCEIFSLEVCSTFDCYRSFAEWGIAKNSGKILLIYFQSDNLKKNSELYTYIQDSLNSLEHYSDTYKEFIIYSHPDISKMFSGYQSYKEYLLNIIKHKTQE